MKIKLLTIHRAKQLANKKWICMYCRFYKDGTIFLFVCLFVFVCLCVWWVFFLVVCMYTL